MVHRRIQAIAFLIAALGIGPTEATPPPYAVATDLFDPAKPDLGLKDVPGVQHITVFAPTETTDKFVNGVVPIAFRGKLYVQWQTSARDEDSTDTRTVYAVSSDGVHFSAPKPLSPPDSGMQTSGGWWTDGRTLTAYLNVWPKGFRTADGQHPGGHTVYRLSEDGETWTAEKPVTDIHGHAVPGIIEQDPHRLPSGRILAAFHLAPGLHVTPYYTHNRLGISGWRAGRMPHLPQTGDISRALEPSLFRRSDGCEVMVFRDLRPTFHQLASLSCNGGIRWSRPEPTDMPDAGAKQSAGNLPDGTAFLINVPNPGKSRIPLTITLSADGRTFNRAFRIRGQDTLPVLKYPGKYKRLGYHYPKSTFWKNALWVGYSVNKEQVALSRLPINALIAAPTEYKH